METKQTAVEWLERKFHFTTITKKPLNEYNLAKNVPHSKKGHKGFIQLENKKDIQLKIVIDKPTKQFLDEYCETAGITKTQLLLGALECYTGFNGENGKECIEAIKCELIDDDFEKAKQMEREQIVDAHFTGSGCNLFDLPEYRINSAYKAAQQYYGEKFGGKDE
jgi:hypothetical protein